MAWIIVQCRPWYRWAILKTSICCLHIQAQLSLSVWTLGCLLYYYRGPVKYNLFVKYLRICCRRSRSYTRSINSSHKSSSGCTLFEENRRRSSKQLSIQQKHKEKCSSHTKGQNVNECCSWLARRPVSCLRVTTTSSLFLPYHASKVYVSLLFSVPFPLTWTGSPLFVVLSSSWINQKLAVWSPLTIPAPPLASRTISGFWFRPNPSSQFHQSSK